ncbi:MFS transporter [Actinotalea sp. M2MS4P-6]|uniref:MFS transporter n=1 Tax=Actinotalea sp. M2MS4P-6 TaxID=2983762 RepID=UPI0021E44988|nr:MFS transporter [Actinotalea sp. M2MS4P-6]MCV2395600.1 MFS transporter [Actinotalea sp. M2MS4P-6]
MPRSARLSDLLARPSARRPGRPAGAATHPARSGAVPRRSAAARAAALPSRLRPGARVLRRPRPPVEPEALRARVALLGLYGLLGITVASWLSRLPTVRADLGLSTGGLGTVLLAGAIASLGTVLVAGGLAERWGSRRTMVVAAWVFSVAAALLGLGPAMGSVLVLAVGVVLMSVSFALGNVPLNVESVRIERAMGRTVVPQFHAAFSVGSVLGSGLGALAAWGHLPLVVHFSLVAVVSLVWRLRTIPASVLPVPVLPVPVLATAALPRSALPTADLATADLATSVLPGSGAPAADGSQAAAPTRVRRGGGLRGSLDAWRDPRTLLLGVVVMAGALSEGTANTWLAIGVVDGFGAREAVGALVFGTFVAAMTVARLGGTVLIDRLGRAPVLVGSMALAVAGLLVYGLSPTLPGAVAGAVAWGLGAGLVIPIAMSATTGDGLGAAGRVAVVSAFGSTANLAAPPVIGLVAEQLGVRHAVLGIAVVMAVGLALGRRATAVPSDSVPASAVPTPRAAPVPAEPVAS